MPPYFADEVYQQLSQTLKKTLTDFVSMIGRIPAVRMCDLLQNFDAGTALQWKALTTLVTGFWRWLRKSRPFGKTNNARQRPENPAQQGTQST